MHYLVPPLLFHVAVLLSLLDHTFEELLICPLDREHTRLTGRVFAMRPCTLQVTLLVTYAVRIGMLEFQGRSHRDDCPGSHIKLFLTVKVSIEGFNMLPKG
jgi:hypothetical protein